jgi:hypothetical protein
MNNKKVKCVTNIYNEIIKNFEFYLNNLSNPNIE